MEEKESTRLSSLLSHCKRAWKKTQEYDMKAEQETDDDKRRLYHRKQGEWSAELADAEDELVSDLQSSFDLSERHARAVVQAALEVPSAESQLRAIFKKADTPYQVNTWKLPTQSQLNRGFRR